MEKNHFLVYLTWSILVLYFLLYLKSILLKLWSYCLLMGPRLSKYLENMTSFHQIAKFSINLTAKWVKNCRKSCSLNVLRAWHIEITQFVCIGGKVNGNVLKCCSILKYRKTTIPLSFLKHSSKSWPQKCFWPWKLWIFKMWL
jgi:hypothetical protein